MLLPVKISIKNRIYKNVQFKMLEKKLLIIGSREGYIDKEFIIDGLSGPDDPFNDLMKITRFKTKIIEKVVEWVAKYGMLINKDIHYENYEIFIGELMKIQDLWLKYKDIQERNEGDLKTWLIAESASEDIFTPEEALSIIIPKNNINNGICAFDGSEIYFNKKANELGLREYQFAGFQYILNKISFRLKSLSITDNRNYRFVTNTDILDNIKVMQPLLVAPNMITYLYLYFYQLLQLNIKICPVCLKPYGEYSDDKRRRADAKACSPQCSDTLKHRRNKRPKLK